MCRRSGATDGMNYREFMSSLHAKWRTMTAAEKKPFQIRADRLPPRVAIPVGPPNAPSTRTPWGLGTAEYPISSATLRATVDSLSPDGRQWLRSAYDNCFDMKGPDAVTNCVVVNTRPRLNLTGLRKKRVARQTCYQCHPGLCVQDDKCSSIKALHAGVAHAVKSFGLVPAAADGEALFLFAGYTHKANADRTLRRFSADRIDEGISADSFELCFLSDQPDIRKSLMTWTRLQFAVTEGVFHFGQHAGLMRSERMVLEEFVSYKFAKRLRDAAKYWVVFLIIYDDLPDEISVVKILGVNAFAAAYGSAVATTIEAGIVETDPLGLEAAFDKSFTGPAVPPRPAPVNDDPLGIDAAFDQLFPNCGGAASASDGDASSLPSPGEMSESDAGTDGAEEDNESDAISGDENISLEGVDLGSWPRAVLRMRQSDAFKREGNRVYWQNRHIGTISSFGPNVACNCRLHTECKAPASQRWPSDRLLELWLLDALNESDAEIQKTKEQHQDKIIALHQLTRQGSL